MNPRSERYEHPGDGRTPLSCYVVGVGGIEPPPPGPRPGILPLHYTPMAGPTGIEPVLHGLQPRVLPTGLQTVAGAERIELPPTLLESGALPLDQAPRIH